MVARILLTTSQDYRGCGSHALPPFVPHFKATLNSSASRRRGTPTSERSVMCRSTRPGHWGAAPISFTANLPEVIESRREVRWSIYLCNARYRARTSCKDAAARGLLWNYILFIRLHRAAVLLTKCGHAEAPHSDSCLSFAHPLLTWKGTGGWSSTVAVRRCLAEEHQTSTSGRAYRLEQVDTPVRRLTIRNDQY